MDLFGESLGIVILGLVSTLPAAIPLSGCGSISRMHYPWRVFDSLEQLRQPVRGVLEALTKDVVRSLTGWDCLLDALFVAGLS